MVDEPFDFDQISEFERDDGNRDKNWIRHQVSARECEEVFFNQPLLVLPDVRHSQTETRYYALGRTNADRRLFVVFTIRGSSLRVISARDMSRKERLIYEKESAA
jgi:uncharacterized DUF497 family protein